MIVQQPVKYGELNKEITNKLIFYSPYEDIEVSFEFDKLLGLTFKNQNNLDYFLDLLNIRKDFKYNKFLKDLILNGGVNFEIVIYNDFKYKLKY